MILFCRFININHVAWLTSQDGLNRRFGYLRLFPEPGESQEDLGSSTFSDLTHRSVPFPRLYLRQLVGTAGHFAVPRSGLSGFWSLLSSCSISFFCSAPIPQRPKLSCFVSCGTETRFGVRPEISRSIPGLWSLWAPLKLLVKTLQHNSVTFSGQYHYSLICVAITLLSSTIINFANPSLTVTSTFLLLS